MFFKDISRKKWGVAKALSSLSLSDKAASEILGLGVYSSNVPGYDRYYILFYVNKKTRLCAVTASAIQLFNCRTRTFDLTVPLQSLRLPNWYYASAADVCISVVSFGGS